MTSIQLFNTAKQFLWTSIPLLKNCSNFKTSNNLFFIRNTRLLSTTIQLYNGNTQIPKAGNKKPVKRPSLTTKSGQDIDGYKSIVAYNLSEELQIENAKKILKYFDQYHLVKLPTDLQEICLFLSNSSQDDIDNGNKLNDVLLFREGTIVFWGVPYHEQRRIVHALAPIKKYPYESDLIRDESEHLSFEITDSEKSKLSKDTVRLAAHQDIIDKQLDQFAFSHAVTKSVKLAVWEALLDKYIDSIGWITSHMKSGKKINLTRAEVFKKTGELYEMKHNINLDSDLLDLPDVYWDRNDQEVLFLSLASNLNISKRTEVINDKLNNCCELMSILGSHMNDKHHVRLEWMIIILIMVEVLFEIFHFF